MYPLYFYVCLLASLASVIVLILLAIFPINLPIEVKTNKPTPPSIRPRKARSPTHHVSNISYWDPPWEDDDDDL